MGSDAFSHDFHPLETLVSNRNFHIGWLANYRGIRFPGANQRFGPDAGIFFIDNSSKDQPPGRQSPIFRKV